MKSLPIYKLARSFPTLCLLIALLIVSLAGVLPVKASPAPQTRASTEIMTNLSPVIFKAEYIPGGSSQHLMAPQAALDPNAPQLSTIKVNYVGNWPASAKNAFEFAKHIWEVTLDSPVTTVVSATWQSLGTNVLGSTSAGDAIRFNTNPPGGAVVDTWYPIALANKLAGRDYNGSAVEIEASFNSGFSACQGGSNCWYFGTDGNPGGYQWDFVSVALHELAHGLGFAGSMVVINAGTSNRQGSWGSGTSYPFIFDRLAVNQQDQFLVQTYQNGSLALADQLTSNGLYFKGVHAMAATGGQKPKLYAPAVWEQGSSFSHLDETAYPAAGGNALMTPYLNNGEVEHAPGAITMGIFQDLGWGLRANYPPRAYLPFMSRNAGGKLFGQVTENGNKAPNVSLTLCRLNSPADTNCTPMGSTTTLADGTYAFYNMPSLETGQKYFAYFKNSAFKTGRLWYWQTRSLATYALGSQALLGNFDISDIILSSPSSPITVTLPVDFAWQVRSASPSDSYEFDLYEPLSGSPNFYTQPPLGHVGSYRLSKLPNGFLANTRYVWEVWAYSPDNAFGISLEARPIAFTPSASSVEEQPSLTTSPGKNVPDSAWR
jgi:hypothetical protein